MVGFAAAARATASQTPPLSSLPLQEMPTYTLPKLTLLLLIIRRIFWRKAKMLYATRRADALAGSRRYFRLDLILMRLRMMSRLPIARWRDYLSGLMPRARLPYGGERVR